MTDPFAPPEVPRAVNDTGPPVPPSGLHPSVSPQAVFTPADAIPPVEAASNIHGTPSHPEFG